MKPTMEESEAEARSSDSTAMTGQYTYICLHPRGTEPGKRSYKKSKNLD